MSVMKNIGAVLLWMVVCADLFAQNGSRMEGMNPSRTNVSSASGPVLQPAFDVIAANVWGSVKRIGLDGSLILSDGATVSSYDTRGRQRWRENIMDVLNGGIADLAIAPSGVVYASSADALIALDPDTGKPIWPQPLLTNSGNESGPLVVDSNGTVYFHTGSTLSGIPEKLTAVNPDGTRKWEHTGHTGGGVGRPVFSGDESTAYLLEPSVSVGGADTIVGLSVISVEVLFETAC